MHLRRTSIFKECKIKDSEISKRKLDSALQAYAKLQTFSRYSESPFKTQFTSKRLYLFFLLLNQHLEEVLFLLLFPFNCSNT